VSVSLGSLIKVLEELRVGEMWRREAGGRKKK